MCLRPEESDGDTFLLILFGVLIIRFKKGTLLLVDHLFLGFFLGNHGSKEAIWFRLCSVNRYSHHARDYRLPD